MKSSSRFLSGAAVVAGAALLVSAAGAIRLDNRWHVTVNGTHFSGTYTNTTSSVVNGFAVGTGLKDKNPITSFTIDGQVCGLYAAYGSAYCYTNIAVKPGETVTFEGDTQAPVGTEGFQMCDSADRGMDNTCLDVAVSKATTTTTSTGSISAQDASELRLATYRLKDAISSEESAVLALKNGRSLQAEKNLRTGTSNVRSAANSIYETGIESLNQAVYDAEHALHLDHMAQPLTGPHKTPAQRVRAQLLIEQALGFKRSALDVLESYHP